MIAADLLRARPVYVQTTAAEYYNAPSDDMARWLFRVWFEYDECLCAAVVNDRDAPTARAVAELVVASIAEVKRWRDTGRLAEFTGTRPELAELADRIDALLQRWRETKGRERDEVAFELCEIACKVPVHEFASASDLRAFLSAASGPSLLEMLRRDV